jgi:hypothetical protein
LAELHPQRIGEDARDHVAAASRRKRNHQCHRPGRPWLRDGLSDAPRNAATTIGRMIGTAILSQSRIEAGSVRSSR